MVYKRVSSALFFSIVWMLLVCPKAYSQSNSMRVARIFSDNMVLQQGIYAPVWGWADSGATVRISMSEKEYETVADDTGKWLVKMEPLPAGGPYTLSVSCGGQKEVFKNVMIGEVWLASGQSNMNYRVGAVLSADEVIKDANYADIREFCTPEVVSRTPHADLTGGEWKVCTPETVKGFSAVAYFFARALHLDKKVPVGIIHTSWSGTICEAWISAEMLYTIPAFKNRVIEEIYKSDEDWAALHQLGVEKDREREKIVQTTQVGLKQGAHKLSFNDKAWKEEAYPVYPPRVGLGGYQLLWLRKEVTLSKEALGEDLILHLGKVMTGDVTYFNGVEVGRERWDGVRSYRVPAKLLRKGKNVIAVRLLSEWGNGRLGDEASDPYLHSADNQVRISLKGQWKYNGEIEPKLPVGRGYSNNITCMYNTKIAPLLPYGIRGFLWYQGEGNSGQPELYKQLQPTMITDWRIRFEQGYLPFLFVQLPNISGGSCQYFREAQAESLQLPNVGMAVSIDVGDPYDIHPNNKKPVGERLYLRAKEMVYKDSVGVFQGPVYNSFRIEGNKIRLKFKSTGSGLMSKDGKDLRTFEVAGEDSKYVPAKAVIEGNDVLVWTDAVKKPLSARHAWDSNPAVNLYNKEGLPATSFRTNKEL